MTGFQNEPVPTTQGGGGGDWIGALIGAGTAIYTSSVAKRNTDKTIAANKSLAEYGYSKDVEAWNRQNDYNSPENQMARLRAAGLNPNMIYGQGSGGAAGQAAQMPKYNAPTVQYNYQPLDLMGILSGYQDFRMKQQQIDNLKAIEENTRAKTLTEAANATLREVQGLDAENKLTYDKATRPVQASAISSHARSAAINVEQNWEKLFLMQKDNLLKGLEQTYRKNQITQQQVDLERKQADLLFQQYRNQWMKMGITTSDSPILRILTRALNSTGIDVSGALGNIGNMVKSAINSRQ